VRPRGERIPTAEFGGSLRAYHLALGWRLFLFATAAGGFALLGYAVQLFWASPARNGAERVEHGAMLVACALLASLFALGAEFAHRTRVVIGPDALEYRELLSSKRIFVRDIQGYRVERLQSGSQYVFVLRCGQKLKIWSGYAFDQKFRDWLATLPNLDANDLARSAWSPSTTNTAASCGTFQIGNRLTIGSSELIPPDNRAPTEAPPPAE
jgi:hypothetical protein